MKIKKRNSSRKKILLTIAVVVAIFAITGAGYYYWRQKQASDRQEQYGSKTTNPTENVPKPSSSTQKNDSSSSSGTSTGSVTSTKDGAQPSASPVDGSVTPSSPVGTFVSNHRPNLDGSPAPNTINSTCRTTAGVICFIEFSNGNVTRSLPEKQTDGNGNVSWDWRLQDINLSEGTWTIKAIAKNGTKTASSKDPVNLEVGP